MPSIRNLPRHAGSSEYRRAAARELARIFGVATVIAFGMSLQFLAQLFVWRNWPVSEVLEGWVYVFRDRLIVASVIALATIMPASWRARSAIVRSIVLVLCVLSGALLGEWAVRSLYGQGDGLAGLVRYSLRWSAVALAAATTFIVWRTSVASVEQLRRETLRRQSVEQQLTNTRLTALRKQIEPHFLFNTLATVRRLHQTDPSAGAGMLASFIDYLRRVLPLVERSEVPLRDEIQLVRAYLSVIQTRMAGRLRVSFQVPASLQSARVPPLAVATLVENAVKHGLAPRSSGGSISIAASAHGGVLEVVVADDGVGLRADAGGGTGIGLYNVRTRLATLHGARAFLQVEANVPSGVCARISLPLLWEGG